jgi:hypothetical protein
MGPEQPDIQQEMDILLGAVARQLRCDPGEIPLELEVVVKASLLAAYNKGFRRARRASATFPAATESAPPPLEQAEHDPNAGVYMYVNRDKKGSDR